MTTWLRPGGREAREREQLAARAEFEDRLRADPEWAAARRVQQDLAENRYADIQVHDFTELRGYGPDGQPVYGDNWDRLHAWLADLRTAAQIAGCATMVHAPGRTPEYTGTAEAIEIMQEGERIARERQALVGKVMGPLNRTVA